MMPTNSVSSSEQFLATQRYPLKIAVVHATACLAAVLVACGLWPSSSAAADILYGVTATHLVTIDPVDPSSVTIVGPHNLTVSMTPSTIPLTLAYDPRNGLLVGNTTTFPTGHPRNLVRYNRATGDATVLGPLSDATSGSFYQGIEYVDSLDSFLAGFYAPPAHVADEIRTVDLFGNTSHVVTTTPPIDINGAVYDSTRDLFYSTDVHGPGPNQLVEIDLVTGMHWNRGAFPLAHQGGWAIAYSADRDAIFLESGGELYRTDAAGPISFTSVEIIAGDPIGGLAFVVPEPSTYILAVLGLIAFGRNRSRIRPR